MKKLKICALIATAMLCGSSTRAADVLVPGVVKEEFYQDKSLADVLGGTAGTPVVTLLPSFEIAVNAGANYSDRVSGVFIPPITGDYGFVLACDDNGQLFLSTDSNPANKVMIAQEPGWSATRTWDTDSGGAAGLQQKNSTTFVPAGGTTAPFANGIHLIAGNKYYIESDHNEGGGGDNNAVAFFTIDGTIALPASGEAPNLTGTNIGVLIPQPASLTFTTQPKTQTVPPNQAVYLDVVVQTDSQAPPTYVWRRNGVIQTNVTGTGLNFVATPADTGAKFDVIATVPGLSATSSVATVTVSGTATALAGLVKQEFWNGKNRTDIENGNAGTPTFVHGVPSFETPTEQGAVYAERVSTYFTPAATGDYNFIIAADDDTDLFLSTDSNAANKVLIAQEPNWSGVRVWTQDNGNAANLPFKDSGTFIPNNPDGTPGTTPLNPNGIHLVGGTHYYMEVVHHEGGGGDNLAITYYPAGGTIPTDGDAPAFLAGELSTDITPDAGNVQILTQPANSNVEPGGSAKFSVTASGIYNFYQWFKGTAAVANATNATLVLNPVTTADNNTEYHVVVTSAANGTTATSSTVTLKVTQIPAPGYVKREFYLNRVLSDLKDPAFTAAPDSVTFQSSFESPVNIADNFAERLSAVFTPPASGDYVFHLTSDDDSELFLSTDATPANKVSIATVPTWTNSREWNNTVAGHSDPITLVAGTKYYIEAVHHEGGGGDDLAVTYTIGDEAIPANGVAPRLTGLVVQTTTVDNHATVTVTTQPANTSVQENRATSFSVAATSTDDLGGTPSIIYQWQKQGPGDAAFSDIPGANGTTYKTGLMSLADTGTKYQVLFTVLGGAQTTSSVAVLTVFPDTFPPIAKAGAVQHDGAVEVGVSFDEAVDTASAKLVSNYSIAGGTVTGATTVTNQGGTLNVAGSIIDVILTTTGLTPGNTYTLTVTGVKDIKGNAMAATPLSFKVTDIQWVSVGTPAVPAAVVPVGADGFDVVSGGSQYWANYDEITFVYVKKTNDFNVKVQVIEQDFSSQWGRGGISVRDGNDEGKTQDDVTGGYVFGAYREIHANPNGFHANVNLVANNNFEANARIGTKYGAADDNTTGWMTGNGTAPAYPDVWLRLERIGETINGYRSTNGVDWLPIATSAWPGAPAVLLVGPGYGPENGNAWGAASDPANVANYLPYMIQYRNFSDIQTSSQPKITGVTTATGNITIVWTGGGTLESSADIASGWATTGNSSGTFTEPITGAAKFYRVKL